MGDPWAQFGNGPGSMVQVGKALSTMGYSNWAALEPGSLEKVKYRDEESGKRKYDKYLPVLICI